MEWNRPSASSWETSAQCAGYSLMCHCRIWHCGLVLFWGGGKNGYLLKTVTLKCYRTFCGPTWKKWMWRMPSFSRMEQRLIRRGDPCKFCRKCFQGSWSPCAVMSGGQHIRLISLLAISSCGAISNQRCTHTNLKTFKPLRMLFTGKSLLFPLQWPNESCRHSEIVSRSVSLMMATTLEIFLKHDDKNYFIYPFLCYIEIFFYLLLFL